MPKERVLSNDQRRHYNELHDRYEDHYYDAPSTAYRQRFIYDPMFCDTDLSRKKVLEIGCGSGHNADHFQSRFPDAEIHGCDISDRAVVDFQAKFGPQSCRRMDITQPLYEVAETYDVIIAVSVAHHLINGLDQALANIHRLLNPGGVFIMYEPNALFMNSVRNLWYKLDKNFDDVNEEALNYDQMKAQFLPFGFAERRVYFIGGPAFYVILNSMILRIPKGFKRATHPFWFLVETYWNRWLPRSMKACFLAEWEKT